MNIFLLAAGSLRNKHYFSQFQFDAPAIIPINMKCVSSYLIELYDSPKNQIYLVINKKDKSVVQKELRDYSGLYNIVEIDFSSGVVDTLEQALSSVPESEETLVNLITTIPTEIIGAETVLLSERLENNNYCSSLSQEGHYQFKRDLSKESAGYAFTGVFRARTELLKSSLKTQNLDRTDLLEVVKAIHDQKTFSFHYDKWIDCGHEINYYEAKLNLISSRFFNSLSVDQVSGLLEKNSTEMKKFSHEVNFVKSLPKELSIFFPRIVSEIEYTGDTAYCSMEYYGYANLAEYMLYWNLDKRSWIRIFQALSEVLKRFNQYSKKIDFTSHQSFYKEKLISRLANFKSQLSTQDRFILESDHLVINGEVQRNFPLLQPLVMEYIDTMYSEKDFTVMHGDFCFNNILYDLRSGIVRLIDARGSFGENDVGIYGDSKYDVAKLYHSTFGQYDYIVNNLFSFNQNNMEINFEFSSRPNLQLLRQLSEDLIEEHGLDLKTIKFITGLLFITMCPLHRDSLERQKTMYCQGIKILNEVLIHEDC